MHHSPLLYGDQKDGYILKIRGDGSSGTAGILWEEGFLMMNVKLNDGV